MDSRQGAKHAKKNKLEIRNPKFETVSNDRKSESSKQSRFGFRNWDLSLWVCFGFRYSDFGFCFIGVPSTSLRTCLAPLREIFRVSVAVLPHEVLRGGLRATTLEYCGTSSAAIPGRTDDHWQERSISGKQGDIAEKAFLAITTYIARDYSRLAAIEARALRSEGSA
jgi:hypothetical protein